MKNLKFLYIYTLVWLLPSIYPFLLGLAVVIAITPNFRFFLLKFTQVSLHLLDFFRSYSNSLSSAFSLLSISVVFIYSSNSATTFSSLNSFTNHLLFIHSYSSIPIFSNLQTCFLLCFLHFWHQAYRYSTVYLELLYYQYSEVLITPILIRKVPITPCLTFS